MDIIGVLEISVIEIVLIKQEEIVSSDKLVFEIILESILKFGMNFNFLCYVKNWFVVLNLYVFRRLCNYFKMFCCRNNKNRGNGRYYSKRR